MRPEVRIFIVLLSLFGTIVDAKNNNNNNNNNDDKTNNSGNDAEINEDNNNNNNKNNRNKAQQQQQQQFEFNKFNNEEVSLVTPNPLLEGSKFQVRCGGHMFGMSHRAVQTMHRVTLYRRLQGMEQYDMIADLDTLKAARGLGGWRRKFQFGDEWKFYFPTREQIIGKAANGTFVKIVSTSKDKDCQSAGEYFCELRWKGADGNEEHIKLNNTVRCYELGKLTGGGEEEEEENDKSLGLRLKTLGPLTIAITVVVVINVLVAFSTGLPI